jgi:hypothetical protein
MVANVVTSPEHAEMLTLDIAFYSTQEVGKKTFDQ